MRGGSSRLVDVLAKDTRERGGTQGAGARLFLLPHGCYAVEISISARIRLATSIDKWIINTYRAPCAISVIYFHAKSAAIL
jgi:hypothetical protein